MIQYVWEAALASGVFSEVLVATEDAEIVEGARAFGAQVIRTPTGFASGTDRVAWVARHRSEEIIVNLQGDEPLLRPDSIRALVEGIESRPDWGMVTLACPRTEPELLRDPNVVKVVRARTGEALYFSRHPLSGPGVFLQHVGIYGYRREVLERLTALAPSPLEKAERLEQLRALEEGVRIGVVEMAEPTVGVDTPEDLVAAEAVLRHRAEH